MYCRNKNGSCGTFPLNKGESIRVATGENTGSRFSTCATLNPDGSCPDGAPFQALSITDAKGGGEINDWGNPLVPAQQLTSQALIGLGYGCTGKCKSHASNYDLVLKKRVPFSHPKLFSLFIIARFFILQNVHKINISDPKEGHDVEMGIKEVKMWFGSRRRRALICG